eukprot:gene7745-9077_t
MTNSNKNPAKPALVHRCKFISWRPSGITAIAKNEELNMIAVGREDSTVELWTLTGQFYMIASMGGSKFAGQVLGIEWHAYKGSNRLITITQDHIYQWDVDSMHQVQSLSAFGGDIKAFALSDDKTMLATATTNMVVNTYKINDDGNIEYNRSFPRITEGSLACLAWCRDNVHVIAGTGAELIVYSTATMASTMSISTREITALCVLDANTVMVGHATGHIAVRELKFGSQSSESRHVIGAVRTIALNNSGDTVFASGDDHSIIKMTRTSAGSWAFNGLHRRHTHDVRAIVVVDDELILSGGIDTVIGVQSVANFTKVQSTSFRHLSMPSVALMATTPATSSSPPMMMEASRSSIALWALGSTDQSYLKPGLALPNGSHLPVTQEARKLVQFDIKDKEYIRSIDLSADGSHFAYSTTARTMLYELTLIDALVTIKRIATLPAADRIRFTPDSTHLILGADTSILSHDIAQNISKHISNTPKDKQKVSVLHMAIDSTGKFVAIVDSVNSTSVFDLEKQKHVISLPNSVTISAIAFHPTESVLYTATMTDLHVFNVKTLKNTNLVPHRSTQPIRQITQNPSNESQLMMWTQCNAITANWKSPDQLSFKNLFPDMFYASVTQVGTAIGELSYIEQVVPDLPESLKLKQFGSN